MLLKSIISYPSYYLETWAKRMSGRGLGDPETNGEIKLLRKVIARESSPVMLDIGAHEGLHTIEALKAAGDKAVQVHMVEALPALAAKLEREIRDPRVSVQHAAVSSTMGEASFFVRSQGVEASGQDSLYRHSYLSEAEEVIVPTVTISSIIEAHEWDRVHFIKIDIEGGEIEAVKSCEEALAKQAIDLVQVEYNQTWIAAGATLKDLFDIARRHQYSIYRLSPSKLLPLPDYAIRLDDYSFQTLIMARNDLTLPMPVGRKPVPFI